MLTVVSMRTEEVAALRIAASSLYTLLHATDALGDAVAQHCMLVPYMHILIIAVGAGLHA
jgi:hypothetical protein